VHRVEVLEPEAAERNGVAREGTRRRRDEHLKGISGVTILGERIENRERF
jgi:hypothetical protein